MKCEVCGTEKEVKALRVLGVDAVICGRYECAQAVSYKHKVCFFGEHKYEDRADRKDMHELGLHRFAHGEAE